MRKVNIDDLIDYTYYSGFSEGVNEIQVLLKLKSKKLDNLIKKVSKKLQSAERKISDGLSKRGENKWNYS